MPGAVGFPVFFKPDDIAFKQGKVARKLFAPGIGEGRHARQLVLDGFLAAAHERQAALDDARDAMAARDAALKAGDLEKFAAEDKKLTAAVEKLLELEEAAASE